MFLEVWKRRNATLAYEWDVDNFEDNELDRPQFIGTRVKPVRFMFLNRGLGEICTDMCIYIISTPGFVFITSLHLYTKSNYICEVLWLIKEHSVQYIQLWFFFLLYIGSNNNRRRNLVLSNAIPVYEILGIIYIPNCYGKYNIINIPLYTLILNCSVVDYLVPFYACAHTHTHTHTYQVRKAVLIVI